MYLVNTNSVTAAYVWWRHRRLQVQFHILRKGLTVSEGSLTQAMINDQLAELNSAFNTAQAAEAGVKWEFVMAGEGLLSVYCRLVSMIDFTAL